MCGQSEGGRREALTSRTLVNPPFHFAGTNYIFKFGSKMAGVMSSSDDDSLVDSGERSSFRFGTSYRLERVIDFFAAVEKRRRAGLVSHP